jgi:Tfp pilus assembly protein PilP
VAAQAVAPLVPRSVLPALTEQAGRIERERRQKQLADYSAQYRLLGIADRGGVKQAFVGKGPDIYIVRQGDMLGDMFLVSLVEESGVKISDVEYPATEDRRCRHILTRRYLLACLRQTTGL